MSEPQANYFALPAFTLWWREMVRFFRQRDRVMGALGTPLVFWLLLGSGLGKSLSAPISPEGHGYLEYFFGGTIVLVLLFTAIFSTISIIEDRREGFLQAVLVAPVGRFGLVLGKILGGRRWRWYRDWCLYCWLRSSVCRSASCPWSGLR